MSEIDLLPVVKPYLSDAIHFSCNIAPHPFICLWAGVGSGKNTLIENIINGNLKKCFPRLTVLLISSRKSKVIETLNHKDLDVGKNFTNDGNIYSIKTNTPHSLENYRYNFSDGEFTFPIYQRSLICTNAAIEAYHKYHFDQNNPVTHLWNRFDLIVWDEAHSLIMDSSFQSAPFHVLKFFEETYARMTKSDTPPRCKHIIFMTGTPEPLIANNLFKKAVKFDMRQICHNVCPKNIHFLTSVQARLQINNQFTAGERIVYFANHVSFPSEVSAQYNIPHEKIAVSFSDEDRRSTLADECKATKSISSDKSIESDYERMLNIEKYLSENERLRPDIALFHTTSRNKEGINIKDKDIHHVYIESHVMPDIKQMIGRIRNGTEHVYIITDSKGHNNIESPDVRTLAKNLCDPKLFSDGLSAADTMLGAFCRSNKLPYSNPYHYADSRVGKHIDLIKNIAKYIEYDYLSNHFHFNRFRAIALDLIADEEKKFKAASKNPDSLVTLFQEEFPYTEIHPFITPEDHARKLGWDFFYRHPNGSFTEAEFDELLVHLDELLTPEKNRNRRKSKLPAPNRLLHKIGLDYKPRNHNRNRHGYSEYMLTPIAEESSGAA